MRAQIPGAKISCVQCDIKREDDIKRLVSDVVGSFKRIDFLVNNSGGQFPASAGRIKTKGWKSVVDLNLNALLFVAGKFFYSVDEKPWWFNSEHCCRCLERFSRNEPHRSCACCGN